MNTVDDLVSEFAAALRDAGVHFGFGADNAFDEAQLLVLGTLGWDAACATDDQSNALKALLRRRIDERMPVPYLIGKTRFANLDFAVAPGIMIPRSPIAELIEDGFQPWLPHAPETILDLCTGSGCIGIACAAAFDSARVTLTDVDDAALAIARQNAITHGVEGRTRFVKSSLFEALAHERFDLIVTNPPYVSTAELAGLPDEYRHEPRLGFDGGDDGLDLWREILAQAPAHLHDDGLLVGEIGNSATALMDAFPDLAFIWPHFERAQRLDGDHFGVFVLAGVLAGVLADGLTDV
ncbi:MAG: 50S ribosomal protein L3 N(5)-glutamine methyltransferase [Gammaproteobacteria bacterium]|nr:50S ribosomal protein L3 N(5)-glutamine methyltransferase [Gammaproteobacteria bacterium]